MAVPAASAPVRSGWLHVAGEPVQAWWFVDMLVHWGLMRKALREHRRAPGHASSDLSKGIAAALFDHPTAGPIQMGKHISDSMMTIGERLGFLVQPETGVLHRRVSTRHRLGRILGPSLGSLLGGVVDLALGLGEANGVYGSRMTGGGFGGCTVSLVDREAVADAAEAIGRDYFGISGIEPAIYESRPARGAHVLSRSEEQ